MFLTKVCEKKRKKRTELTSVRGGPINASTPIENFQVYEFTK